MIGKNALFKKALLSVLLGLGSVISSYADIQALDRIIAIVDEGVVMESELIERLRLIKEQLAKNNTQAPPDSLLAQQVLERLIIERLQIQMGQRAGIRIDDTELNRALANVAAQNGMNLQQFRSALISDGISYRQTREQIRQEMIINRVRQGRVGRRIKVTEKEIDNFLASKVGQYETSAEYRVAHILLPFPSDSSRYEQDRVAQLATDLKGEIDLGGDFSQLAVARSSGDKALQGGDLGYRKAVQLPSLFADVVINMEKGDVSAPIRSASGFHLIKLTDIRGGGVEMVEQIHLRHIIVEPSEIRSDEEAKVIAQTVRDRAAAGEEFIGLAKEYSDDNNTALSGGDLDWVNLTQLPSIYQQKIQDRKAGYLSEVFRTPVGWHLVYLEGRREEDQSEDFKRNQAARFVHGRKFDEEIQVWLQEIRDEAYVQIKL